jgi:hypothetical protein
MMILTTTTRSRRGSVAPKGRCIRYANACTPKKFFASEFEVVTIEVEVVAIFQKFTAIDLDFVTIDFDLVAIDLNVVPIDSGVVPIALDVVPVDVKVAAIDPEPVAHARSWVPFGSTVVANPGNGVAVGFFLFLPDFGRRLLLGWGGLSGFFLCQPAPSCRNSVECPCEWGSRSGDRVARGRDSDFCARGRPSPLTHGFWVLAHRWRVCQISNCGSAIASRVAPHRSGGVAIRSRAREIAETQIALRVGVWL